MNQFAILFQLAFLYILYAPVAAREKILEIKEAKITSAGEGVSSQVFNTGKVNLYQITREPPCRLEYYVIDDESDEVCLEFPIARHNTVVTKDSITVKWFERTITMILKKNVNTFSVYGALLPLGEFACGFPIVKAVQGTESLKLKDGVVRTEPVENDDLLLVIADGKILRVVFPKSCATIVPKEESGKEVLIELGTEPTVVITIQFDGFISANTFHKYFSLWPNHLEAVLANLRHVSVSDQFV